MLILCKNVRLEDVKPGKQRAAKKPFIQKWKLQPTITLILDYVTRISNNRDGIKRTLNKNGRNVLKICMHRHAICALSSCVLSVEITINRTRSKRTKERMKTMIGDFSRMKTVKILNGKVSSVFIPFLESDDNSGMPVLEESLVALLLTWSNITARW